jgi:hypothetical protein
MSAQAPVTDSGVSTMDGVISGPIGEVEQVFSDNQSTIDSPPDDASDVVQALTDNSRMLFTRLATLVRQDPNSTAANEAYLAYKSAEEKLTHFKQAQNSYLKIMDESSSASASTSNVNRPAIVPSGLPFLQLRGEHQWKPREEMYDSAHDFCVCFEKVLRALTFKTWMSIGNVCCLCV